MTAVLVLVTGLPAAGKTTLAGPLAATLGPEAGPRLRALEADLIEVFCHCPPAELERRFAARVPTRHPGHVDHLLAPEMKASLARGIGPLHLGGPVLEIETVQPVDVAEVATWVRAQLSRPPPGGGA